MQCNVKINDTYVLSDKNIMSYDGRSTVTIASGTINVPHNSDGSKSISFEFNVWDKVTANYLPGNAHADGSMDLTKIARYANITTFYVINPTLNSVTIGWNADSECDQVQYSVNNGSWQNSGGLEFGIGGLNPNTEYSFKIRVKRKDSQLWTESSVVTATTKDIAKISSANNFNHGDGLSVSITNPSGKTASLAVKVDGTQILNKNLSAGANTINFSDTELDNIYKKYGSNNSVTVNLILTTDSNSSYTNSKNVTCTLKGNQKTIRNKVNNNWRRGKTWINISGTWRRAVVWQKINGTWRRGI